MKATRLLDFAPKTLKNNDNEFVGDCGKTNKMVINSSKNNQFKKLMHMLNIKVIEKFTFHTLNTIKTFNQIKQAFIKTLII